MTAAALPEQRNDRFHQPAVFRPVVAATIAVAVAMHLIEAPGAISVAVVVAVVAFLGIPHGAVDHLAAEALGGPFDTSSPLQFARSYVLMMLGVGLVWLIAPAAALAVFLVLSIHHFGQSDLAYLGLPARRALLVQWSRGLLLVGLPLVAHLEIVSPVIERLGGGDPASWAWLADRWALWSVALVAQHVMIGGALSHRFVNRPALVRESVAVAVLTTLLLTADPLIGFAVYFGLWHSLAHLYVLGDLLGAQPAPLRSVVRLAAPLSVVSVVGIVAIVIGAAAMGRTDLIVALMFVFVSMLTMPHMIVVERIWSTPTVKRVPASGTQSSAGLLPGKEAP
jgi:Brp/Blh family beta-carotene 15,15'-monooxygenase